MRVFVADDSATLRQHLIEMVSQVRGVEPVGYAADAQTAIELIPLVRPDVVLLDIQLKRSSGFQVLQNIKTGPNRSIVIIVLTNFAFPQYQKKYMEAGADYFFDKSTEFEKVTRVLKDMTKLERGN